MDPVQEPAPPQPSKSTKTIGILVGLAAGIAAFLIVRALLGGGWTSAQEQEWMEQCQAQGGSNALCSCVLEKWQEDDKSFDDVSEDAFSAGFSAGVECGQEGRI
jgi:hypothetical protein